MHSKGHISNRVAMTNPVLTVSIVLYKNDPSHIVEVCLCLLQLNFSFEVYFLDNSPDDTLAQYISKDDRLFYTKSTHNLGYGKGHNQIIYDQLDRGKYHLVVNADVFFLEGVLEELMAFMDTNQEVGLVMPRVLNPDGTDQYLYKLLPSPGVMLLRRFCPAFVQRIFSARLEEYEMSFAHPEGVFEVPYLSGCFMWLRKEAIKELGAFDTRFFMYFEDVDLSRNIGTKWKLLYHGSTAISHYFQRGSYGHFKLMVFHVVSAVKYFSKYGWLDSERKRINTEAKKKYHLKYGKGVKNKASVSV